MVKKKNTSNSSRSIAGKITKTRVENRGRISNLRKAQITRAAYKAICEKGYYNITVEDIAQEAGLSVGLIHHYFIDKEGLLVALLKEMQTNIGTRLSETLVPEADPRSKLDVFIRQAFDIIDREKEFLYVLFDFRTQIKHNDRMRRIISRLYESYRDACASIILEGVRSGAFAAMDEKFSATLIISVIQGTMEQYLLDRGAFDYPLYSRTTREFILALLEKRRP